MWTKSIAKWQKKYENEDDINKKANDYILACLQHKRLANLAGLLVFMDITDDTWYEYCKADVTKDICKKIYAKLEDFNINDKTQSPDIRKMYLKARHKEVYREEKTVNIEVKKLEDVMKDLELED